MKEWGRRRRREEEERKGEKEVREREIYEEDG